MSPRTATSGWRTAAWGAGLLLALAHPLAYLGMFAGDAEIHLVFGRSAAEGRFFEFNPGEPVAGETSPGYMLLLGLLFRLAPESWVPLLLKAGGLASWYALVALTYVAARRILGSATWAGLAAILLALMPGSAYNATTGMENVLFALGLMAVVVAAANVGWWDGGLLSGSSDVGLGAALGLLCWLRPEAYVASAVAIGLRAAGLVRRHGARQAASGLTFAIGAWLPLAFCSSIFQYAYTGALLPASGLARVAISTAGAPRVAGIPLDPKLALRLGAYLPMTAAFVVATWSYVRGRSLGARPPALGFALLLTWTSFVLFSTVLGSAHLARYLLAVAPYFAIGASWGARLAWEMTRTRTRWRLAGAALGAVWLSGVFAVEAYARRDLGRTDELLAAARAPHDRSAFSDRLFECLGRPSALPVVVACQEVQVRYWLDDRFVVRSLDGRVDPMLLRYVRGGVYDHVAYLKERRVDYLYSRLAAYGRDPGAWSLASLNELAPGESATHEGLRFTRLACPELVRVEPESPR